MEHPQALHVCTNVCMHTQGRGWLGYELYMMFFDKVKFRRNLTKKDSVTGTGTVFNIYLRVLNIILKFLYFCL